MFTGTYYGTIDDKNRFRLNKAHKQYLPSSEPCYITKWSDGHIVIITQSILKDKMAQIAEEISDFKLRDREIRRITAMCVELKEDSQGRYNLPKELKEITLLDKEIAMLGVIDKVEIWDKQEWVQEMSKS